MKEQLETLKLLNLLSIYALCKTATDTPNCDNCPLLKLVLETSDSTFTICDCLEAAMAGIKEIAEKP